MKKILTLILVIVMIAGVGISAVADMGGFMESPSKNKAPTLVSATNESTACTAKLVITAYADRNDISAEDRQAIENAYASIRGVAVLSNINKDLATVAEAFGLKGRDLAVSDLFNIHITGCTNHSSHGHFDVVLAAETLNNFVCLMRFDGKEWHIVEGAEVTNNGEHLEFDTDKFGAFAIVVATKEMTPVDSTEPGNDNVALVVTISLIALIALAVAAYFIIKKFKPEWITAALDFFKGIFSK